MYFRAQNRTQLLQIADNYAHLSDVSSAGDLTFEFTYSISQREAVARKALRVDVSIESRHVAKKSIMGQSHRGVVDTRAIVDNLRTAMIDAKSTAEQRIRNRLASRSSDITPKINNDILPQLRSHTASKDIPTLNRPRLKLVPVSQVKQSNDPQPVLHRIASSRMVPSLQHAMTASAAENPQALMHEMIARQGLDPSHVFELAPRVVSEFDTHRGLSTPSRATEEVTDPSTRLLHRHLFPPTTEQPARTTGELVDTELVHVLSTVTSDEVEVTVPLTIPVSQLRLEGVPVTQAHVMFELIDGETNTAIDTVTKVLDISRHVQVYYTPKIPPQVRHAGSDVSTRVNLEIKQIDPGATEVEVYKKTFWVATPEVDDYALIGTYPLTARDQSLLVQVDRPLGSPVLYRVVPRGRQSTQGFEYTNVAIKPARYTPVRAVSLTAHQVDTGVQLEVRQIPSKVVAIQFMRLNLTTFETTLSTVGVDVGFIDESTRQADLITTIDRDVAFDNIYQYVARLIYLGGSTTDFGAATIEFIKPSPGEVDTKIENLQVDHDDTPNVTFKVTTTVVDTDLDAVRRMLEKQGLMSYFTTDVQKQRDQLKQLIAHQVCRVDLNTGTHANFGILSTDLFDDDALRKNQAISPLEYGHRYRYIVYPLLRRPETLFDDFRKDAVDAVTKKPYTFMPAKFQHPFTLKRGVIVSSKGVLLRQAKDPMAHGVIGSIATTEVSFDTDTARVTDATASNFDRYLNVVSWKILGDVHNIDHFIVMKQVHGMRSLVGKCHSEFANGSCQYIHRVSQHDVGALQYVITPVFNDYRLGTSAVTNTLLVVDVP